LKLEGLLKSLPEVEPPKKKLNFKTKLIWTGAVLLVFFVLGMIPLWGLDPNAVSRFETLQILLAANFGSLISLGIGPIVTGSIILQLLIGAEIIKIDTTTHEGREMYQGMQKLFSIFFIVVENAGYVLSGALPAAGGLPINTAALILQLIVGGFLLLLLDEVVSKWGIGSGISLFIAAGVSKSIFVRALSPFKDASGLRVGAIWRIIALIAQGVPGEALWPLVAIVATIVVFALAVYLQAVKIDIPLTFSRIRGFSIRWPIKLLYTSNIPVILVAALIASMQLWGVMLYNAGLPILGTYETQQTGQGVRQVPVSGLVKYLNPPTIRTLFVQGLTRDNLLSILVYSSFMIIGAMFFSVLWMKVGGQDPSKVAEQIFAVGLSLPGFRRDPRILEQKLRHYIYPMAIVGGAAVGFLAAFADLLGALSRGTGILLTVMIVYTFYEQLQRQHPEEMSLIAKWIGGKR